jgi:LuxR family maltose regulon positive regulatory protein
MTTWPLLVTKLSPRESGRPLLERPHLVERLLANRDQCLLFVCTPAGYGRTTLLTQLRNHLRQQGCLSAWLSCEETDSEPRRLLRYLLTAVAVQLPDWRSRALALLEQRTGLPNTALLDAFIGDLRTVDRPLYLILDDFHRIRHPDLTTMVAHLLEHLPRNVRLIISSLQTPRLLHTPVGDCAYWADANDLCLSRDESAHYLRTLHKLPLSDQQVEQLHSRCEGWITGLMLAANSLQGGTGEQTLIDRLSGVRRDLYDYFEQALVPGGLPEHWLQFLARSTLLDEFSADMCDALSGRQDSEQILERLQHGQFFIEPLDDKGEWMRHHPLFAQFCQRYIAQHLDNSHLLHAAARWCASHAQPDRAIRYALRAHDYAFAADFLQRQGARLIAGNQVYRILATLKHIPSKIIRTQPIFQVFYAWQLALEHKYPEAEALLEAVSNRLLQARNRRVSKGIVELLGTCQLVKALVLLYQDKLVRARLRAWPAGRIRARRTGTHGRTHRVATNRGRLPARSR